MEDNNSKINSLTVEEKIAQLTTEKIATIRANKIYSNERVIKMHESDLLRLEQYPLNHPNRYMVKYIEKDLIHCKYLIDQLNKDCPIHLSETEIEDIRQKAQL